MVKVSVEGYNALIESELSCLVYGYTARELDRIPPIQQMCFEYANSGHSFKIVVLGRIGLLRVGDAERETYDDGALVTYSVTRNVDGTPFDLLICEADGAGDIVSWDADDSRYEKLCGADA